MGNGDGLVDKQDKEGSAPLPPVLQEFLDKNSIRKENVVDYVDLYKHMVEKGLHERVIIETMQRRWSVDIAKMTVMDNSQGETAGSVEHDSNGTSGMYRCELCKMNFPTRTSLDHHLQTAKVHNSDRKIGSQNSEHSGKSHNEVSVTQSVSVASRRPSLDRRRSFDPPAHLTKQDSHVSCHVRHTKRIAANQTPVSTSTLAAIHNEMDRTTNLLMSYYESHPRSVNPDGEGVIFNGGKLVSIEGKPDEEYMTVLITLLPGPELAVCSVPVVVEIVVTSEKKLEGKLYLSYSVLKELLSTELTKAADASTEHMIVSQYCVTRLVVTEESLALRVMVKHDTFSAGETMEKKLDKIFSGNPRTTRISF
jgi:hypothetical protein